MFPGLGWQPTSEQLAIVQTCLPWEMTGQQEEGQPLLQYLNPTPNVCHRYVMGVNALAGLAWDGDGGDVVETRGRYLFFRPPRRCPHNRRTLPPFITDGSTNICCSTSMVWKEKHLQII
jgi:hypothetical protein